MTFRIWLGAVALTILAGIVLPYGPLSGAGGLTIPVFWGLFGLAVVALVAMGLARWRR